MEMMLAVEHGGQLSIGLIFWILMLFWLVFGFYTYWPRAGTAVGYSGVGGHGLLFFLLLLLGIGVFGFPVG